uniref:CTNNB1_binding domain-containing protein n=1 Tax=Meloidogyne hapla TaxID=6305 RepID=A0A1I8BJY2_MELHA
MKKESNKREVDKPQNVEGSLENNGKERQMQSGSSAEEEIMGEDDSDEFDADSLDDGEEKEIININGNLTSSQKKQAEENNQVEGQQNPIEKLYNMHQTYFAFA